MIHSMVIQSFWFQENPFGHHCQNVPFTNITWRRAYFSFCLASSSERFFDSSSRVLSFCRSASRSFLKGENRYLYLIYNMYMLFIHILSSEQYLFIGGEIFCKDSSQKERTRNFCTVWYVMQIYLHTFSMVSVCNVSKDWEENGKSGQSILLILFIIIVNCFHMLVSVDQRY